MNGSNCTCSALEVLPLLADEDIVSTSSCLSSLRRSQPKFHHENDTHGSLRNHRRLLIVDLQFAVSYVCETCPKPLKLFAFHSYIFAVIKSLQSGSNLRTRNLRPLLLLLHSSLQQRCGPDDR